MKLKRTARHSRKGLIALSITLVTSALLTAFAGAAGFGNLSFSSDHGTCSESNGGTIECLLGTLAPGESATVQVSLIPTSPGTLTDTASAFGSEPDTDPTNNTASVITKVIGQPTVPNSADVSVVKSTVQSRISVGTPFIYQVVVTNNGPIAATNVMLNDFLPLTVNFVSASGASCVGASGISVVTCSVGDLAVGASAVVNIQVVPTSVGPIINRATVSADQPDPNLDNNQDVITTDVVARSVDLRVSKTGTPNPVTVGGQVTYTITVTNDGPDPASNVTLTDAILGGN